MHRFGSCYHSKWGEVKSRRLFVVWESENDEWHHLYTDPFVFAMEGELKRCPGETDPLPPKPVSDVGPPQSATDAEPSKSSAIPEPEMVVISPGTFRMGCVSGKGCAINKLAVRTVTFREPFAIGKYEVTFEEYDAFAEATDREKPNDWGWGRGRRPVIDVTWKDAKAYAEWLSDQTGKRYRLPNEAEWEYATRAGSSTPFSTGDCINTTQANYNGDYGWEDCPATDVYWGQTVEAGSLPANPWGLHEVHGNVAEWVEHWRHESHRGSPPADGSLWREKGSGDRFVRVLRGGSWSDGPEALRSAAGKSFYSYLSAPYIGF